MKSLLNGTKNGTDQERGSVAEKGLLTKNLVLDGDKNGTTPNTLTFNRKTTGPATLRKWVKYDKGGATTMVQADKYALTHQLGVQVGLHIFPTQIRHNQVEFKPPQIFPTFALTPPAFLFQANCSSMNSLETNALEARYG